MWQDDYITKLQEDQYICWDNRGEFIALATTRDSARNIINEYKDKRQNNERTVQQLNGVMQER